MAEGLRRAAAVAKATRKGKCPVCGKTFTLRLQTAGPRLPVHGPPGNRCLGQGRPPKEAAG